MTNMKKFSFLLLSIALLASSCGFIGGKRIRGNGNWKTADHSVGSFDAVEVHGAMDVYVSQGPAGPVKIETDENLQEYVEVFVSGSKLVIRTKSGVNLRPTNDMKVYVTAPLYRKIDVSGACDIIGQSKLNNSEPLQLEVSGAGEIRMEVNAPKVEVDLSGSGAVHLAGETREFDVDLSGAADAKCFDLKSESTRVEISGAGDAEVYASVQLNAKVSGAGSVRYKGNASTVNQSVSGAGSVKKAE
jgi:hypothetical protein